MYETFRLLVSVSCLISFVSCDYAVKTNVGVIEGLASSDGSYAMYLGIPFALVNASNPFGVATKYPNFDQPYKAYDDSFMCPQVYLFNNSIVGTLDCLRLNIYVPLTASPTNKLPVMIRIHGGYFKLGFAGRAMYGPKYLIKHNVILVTIGYRLGPYGFMCVDIPEAPGNQGLKDQYMAMKWVHDNIEAFGGDVVNITLFGESAGGHSIEFHLRSQNENLFNKVIIESGSAVAGTNFFERDRQAPNKLAAYLGYTTTDLYEALAFLASSEPKQVIEASVALNMYFKPCVEKVIAGVDNFITTTWVDTPVPKVADIPVLLGFNKEERMFEHYNKNTAYFEKTDIFRDNLEAIFNFSQDELKEMEKLVRHFYIGDEPLSRDVVWPIINFDSDFTYIHPIQRSITKFIESRAGNVFYYMFAYSGGRNFFKNFYNITDAGAVHADQMGYLFDMNILPDEATTEDQLILDRMTKMWTNFAKYSTSPESGICARYGDKLAAYHIWDGTKNYGEIDPTPGTTDLLPVKWTPVTADTFYCMNIDSNLTLTGRPLHERMAFWDLLLTMNKEFLKKLDV